MSSCIPVIPEGSRYYDIPYLSENELIPTSRKSQVLREAQLSALERPVFTSPKDQVAYLNNMSREASTFTLKGKTPTQLREEAFEIEFLERAGNELFTMWNTGEISEDEFFSQVAKERRLLRIELEQTPTEGETTTEYEIETESETNLVGLDPRTISDEEAGLMTETIREVKRMEEGLSETTRRILEGLSEDEGFNMGVPNPELIAETEIELQRVGQELRSKGGFRPGAGRMTREEKRLQGQMIMEGKGKPSKTAIREGKKAVEDILAEVFSRVEV